MSSPSSRSQAPVALPSWGDDLDDNLSLLSDWLYSQNRKQILREERQASSESVELEASDMDSAEFEALTGQGEDGIYTVFDAWHERNEESSWENNDYAERQLAKELLSDPDGKRVQASLARHMAKLNGDDPDDEDFDEDDAIADHNDAVMDAFLERLREHSFFNYELSVKGEVGGRLSFEPPKLLALQAANEVIEVMALGQESVPVLAQFNATPGDLRDARRIASLSAVAAFFGSDQAEDLTGAFARAARSEAAQASVPNGWPVAADAHARWEALEAQVWADCAEKLNIQRAIWAREEQATQTPGHAVQSLRAWVEALVALDDALVSEELPGLSGRALKALGLDSSEWVCLFDPTLLDEVAAVSPYTVSYQGVEGTLEQAVEWPALDALTTASLNRMDAQVGPWEIPQTLQEAQAAQARVWNTEGDSADYWFATSAIGARLAARPATQLNPLFALQLCSAIEENYGDDMPNEITFEFTVDAKELEAMGYAYDFARYNTPSFLVQGETQARTLEAKGILLDDNGDDLLSVSSAVWMGLRDLSWQQSDFPDQSARASRQGGLVAESTHTAMRSRYNLTQTHPYIAEPHFFSDFFRALSRVEDPSLRDTLARPAVLPWIQAESLEAARTQFTQQLAEIGGSYFGALSADKIQALADCLEMADAADAQTARIAQQSSVPPVADSPPLVVVALNLRAACSLFNMPLADSSNTPSAARLSQPSGDPQQLLRALELNSGGALARPVLLQDIATLLTTARQEDPQHLRALLDATDALGQSALHRAALMGNEPLSRLLLSHGANPQATDCLHRTPLLSLAQAQIAQGPSYWKSLEHALRLFMAYGADLNAQQKDGKNLGHLLNIGAENRARLDGLGLRGDAVDRFATPAVDKKYWNDRQRSEFDATSLSVAMETPTGPLLPPRIMADDPAHANAPTPVETVVPQPTNKRSRRL